MAGRMWTWWRRRRGPAIRKRQRRSGPPASLILALLLASAPVRAEVRGGDFVLAERGARRIVTVDAASGEQSALADALQLIAPVDVLVEPDGSAFVSDSERGRILRVGPESGTFRVVAEGRPLSKPFGLDRLPRADGGFDLLVADPGRAAVLKVDPETGDTTRIYPDTANGVPAEGDIVLEQPYDVAFAGDGRIVVTDVIGDRLIEIDLETRVASLLTRERFLNRPQGVAVGPDGTTYIADASNDAVVTWGESGSAGVFTQDLLTIGSPLGSPRDVVLSQDGFAYVSDAQAGIVLRVNLATGAKKVVVNRTASERYAGIDLDLNGDLVALNTANRGVVRIDLLPGIATRLLNFDPADPEPRAVETTSDGEILVLGSSGSVWAFDPDSLASRLISSESDPGPLPVDPIDAALSDRPQCSVLYVTDRALQAVIAIDTATGARSLASQGGLLGDPAGLAFDPGPNDQQGDPDRCLDDSLLVTDSASASLVRIDLGTGQQTLITQGGLLSEPVDVALTTGRKIMVLDSEQRAVVEVNPEPDPTAVPPIEEQVLVAETYLLDGPVAIASGPGNFFWIANADTDAIVRLNASNGERLLLTAGEPLDDLRDLAVSASGEVYLASGSVPSATPGVRSPGIALARQEGLVRNQLFVGTTIGRPTGVDFDAEGRLVVVDESSQRLYRVDVETGAVEPVARDGSLSFPQDIAVDEDGTYFVASSAASSVVRVDPTNGEQIQVAVGGRLFFPGAIEVEADGRLLVLDQLTGELVRVEPVSGAQELVSSQKVVAAPTDMALDLNGDAILAPARSGKVVRIDRETGVPGVIAKIRLVGAFDAVDVGPTGHIFVSGGQKARLIQVDPTNGATTTVSRRDLLAAPAGAVIVPMDAARDGCSSCPSPDAPVTARAKLAVKGSAKRKAETETTLALTPDGRFELVIRDLSPQGEGAQATAPQTIASGIAVEERRNARLLSLYLDRDGREAAMDFLRNEVTGLLSQQEAAGLELKWRRLSLESKLTAFDDDPGTPGPERSELDQLSLRFDLELRSDAITKPKRVVYKLKFKR